mmetsp:Transcript_8876/g.14776  ORF Transcript_8876/g.14776 Transcript_8876/m.14776 type:complete len:480 (-) Transcript_8876:39-1478(-)
MTPSTTTTMEVTAASAIISPQPTYIGRLILGIRDCLAKLGAEATNIQLEEWAIFIHESMSSSSRNYHSVKHVFDLADGWDDPIGVLSAYFHDCIYYDVDGGLSACQAVILKNVMETRDGDKILLNQDPEDELLELCMIIFGFRPDQVVTTGLNEFLSALIAVRELQEVMSKPILSKIVCCIEATIAFRTKIDGETALDRLYDRMVKANVTCKLGLSEEELVEAVQRAALLSNRDLGNFGSQDRAYFLDNTWSLLPELNKSLRDNYCYTVAEFQLAVVKMNGFFTFFLKEDMIFSSFRGVPSQEVIQVLEVQARRNLEIARTYVGAKVLSVSLLAAFAELTGGDAPMSLFMGDLPSRLHVSRRLEDYLPITLEGCGHNQCDPEVYNILAHGRTSETSFDIRQSPLAAYLYGCMGSEGVAAALSGIKLHPMTKETAKELLKKLPRDAVLRVAQNMAKVALSRQDLILKLVMELGEEEKGEE